VTAATGLAVAALSARVLAQSARRAGLPVLALDLFGDRDTRAASNGWGSIGAPSGLRIDPQRLADELLLASRAGTIRGWIGGAGIESLGAALHEIEAQVAPLAPIGNRAAVIDALRDPARFFALLDSLDVPHPPVCLAPPVPSGDWLIKDARAGGGWHIRRCQSDWPGPEATDGGADAPDPGHVQQRYLQQRAGGESRSLLFIADGRRAWIAGFSRQWVEPLGDLPYLYRGAIGPLPPPEPRAREVGAALDRIVAATGLLGLGSLDYLDDGDRWQVLEINPRPSATMALYDALLPEGLLAAHIAACGESRLPEAPLPFRGLRASRIVFAEQPLLIDAAASDALLAQGYADVPAAGTRIGVGEPLCSIELAAADEAEAVRRIAARTLHLHQMLEPCHERVTA
jgi:uncharacterized protein